MKHKIVTLGEIMLRLSSPHNCRLVQCQSMDVCYGGGEANVAVSLANYGEEAYFVSKVPKHEIGQSAVNALKQYGVHDKYIVRGGDRLGIYFLESGSAMRASKVIYDRSNSAIAEADEEEFDFDRIMKDASWFHFSGITPAISEKAAKLTKAACIAAKKYDVTVSCDLNYRKKLWTPKQAQSVMKSLMEYVDVCIGNEEDAQMCLGFKPEGSDVSNGKLDVDGYKNIFEQMQTLFKFKKICTTLRESYSASHNGWSALLYDGSTFYQSKHYDIEPIVDRVGGGDSFSGGLIYGLLNFENCQDALEFAVAASALKHTIPGDFNHVGIDEVLQLVNGDGSGRVQR